jgi:hypothetical protein
MNTPRLRYDFQRYLARHARRRALSCYRPWLIGHAAGGAAMLAVSTACADNWQKDTSAWAGGVCAALRGQVVGDRPLVDPDQAIDIIVVRRDAAGAGFRCPPTMPGKRLPSARSG